ncbi:MAG: GMC oxidoreductase, partial [Terriglobia bacterium]
MLSKDWRERKPKYDVVVIGSGYGGAITAARIASAPLNPKSSVCILERGREWQVGEFPDSLPKASEHFRSPVVNPTGLFDFPLFKDIAVIKGCGLGGTSLINANVAIVPDDGVFLQPDWPRSVNRPLLQPYYDRARQMLASRPHPRAQQLLKIQALERRAREIGLKVDALDINVNFDIDGENAHGVPQKPCIDCGDCLTGCNVGAKNTLAMNYLPMARANGVEMFTHSQVDWIEALSGGGWRVHGRRHEHLFPEAFTLDAGCVILAGGALGTPEILLRSEVHGLSLSPRAGTRFSGNGDFFGFAFNGEYRTNVLGFGNHPASAWRANAPGPSIVGAIRYDGDRPLGQRITFEDLGFPTAYVSAAMIGLGALGGEPTVAGFESEEKARLARDNPFEPYQADNALNHTMFYLVMGQDQSKGTMRLHTGLLDPNGRLEIDWDGAGNEPLFAMMNEEVRRHARALDADFIPNPWWHFLSLRRLVTAHPLGGMPLGEDYLQGAVDEFGRVFTAQGGVHENLFVADGSLVPSALGVNPLLTISALSERIAARLVRNFQGEAYPAPPASVSVHFIDPIETAADDEADLERIFTRVETLGSEVMVNTGEWSIDVGKGIIRNDTAWRGFFPKGHVLNHLSSALKESFQKKFTRTPSGVAGVTSATDGLIFVNNTLEEVSLDKPSGSLEEGKYILLRYTGAPWSVFYDIFKVINPDLLIGRVYLGSFPHGARMITFPMTRVYALDEMTASDHAALYQRASAPTPAQLNGLWEMRCVSNAGDTGVVAYLMFTLTPDGRLESRYRFLGLLEGLVEPVFGQDHFQLDDFTPFHDEIRAVSPDFMVGRYTSGPRPVLSDLFGPGSLGLFQVQKTEGGAEQFCFDYTLTRSGKGEMPAAVFLEPLLAIHLPDGVGMTFAEQMEGFYFPGLIVAATPGGDQSLEARVGASGKPVKPAGGAACSFQVEITIRNVNEFLINPEHEAALSGTIHFEDFAGRGPASFAVDASRSTFNYLRVDPATGITGMLYRLYFEDAQKESYCFAARKVMRRDPAQPWAGPREILHDYTTAYCHLTQETSGQELGSGVLKFRTFQDFSAVRSLGDFLKSFQVTGTDSLWIKAHARLRFLAFTNQFIVREYEPSSVVEELTADEVRAAVLRGASEPDEYSTRPTAELQTVLREAPTLPLETLLNHGGVTIDYANRRIWRDSFWKGSFAKDSLLGREERLRDALLDGVSSGAAMNYTGGSFWKRFNSITNGEVAGYVVNYQLNCLPGRPVVKQVKYPNDNRKYFRAGDDVLLLSYLNQPYRKVYDTIKAVDANNCIGVMHIGDFPNGVEFATFVMARNNYPFEKMSVADHQTIFNGDHVHAPTPAEVTGAWEGHLIFLTRPDVSLLNQLNPVAFRLRFMPTPNGATVHYQFGVFSGAEAAQFTPDAAEMFDSLRFHDEIRMIDGETMIGKWVSPTVPAWLGRLGLETALAGYLEPGRDRLAFYYLLTR